MVKTFCSNGLSDKLYPWRLCIEVRRYTTDAKSLFDAARSVSALRVTDKRTAIEVYIVKERLNAMFGYLRWVNSTQQVADGSTKPTAKYAFAHNFNKGVRALT